MTAIEWTDITWNVVTGCSKVSPGCAHCYAETLAKRLHRMGQEGYTDLPWTPENAKANVILHPDRLEKPLRLRRPRMVFVNSMSDLFHEEIEDDVLAYIFAVMALAPQHTFQVLTKRPERMREFFTRELEPDVGWLPGSYAAALIGQAISAVGPDLLRDERAIALYDDPTTLELPLPNVWLGVSIENRRYVHRPDLLRETPAAVRFISAEPLLSSLIPDGTRSAHGEGGARTGAGGARPDVGRSARPSLEAPCMEEGHGTSGYREIEQDRLPPRSVSDRSAALLGGSPQARVDDQQREVRTGDAGHQSPQRRQGGQSSLQSRGGSEGLQRGSRSACDGADQAPQVERGQAYARAGDPDAGAAGAGRHEEDRDRQDVRCDLPDGAKHRDASQVAGDGLWLDGYDGPGLDLTGIDWLIVGGESGPGHRPMRAEWVRDLRDAVLALRPVTVPGLGTQFFFKQWGGATPKSGGRVLDGRTWDEMPNTNQRRPS